MKIIGLKKAIGDFKRANADRYYSPRYGYLMYDISDGHIWTDEFYDFGHNSYTQYNSDSIINLGSYMADMGIPVTMANVKKIVNDPLFWDRYQYNISLQ